VTQVDEHDEVQSDEPDAGAGEVLLVAQGVTKRFGGINALNDVSLEVHASETVGLVGPNGAGKTTFFNCLLGMLKPDSGSVRFRGHNISRMPTHRRARLGIGRTFQRLELFTGMTPREHLLVTERSRRNDGALWKDLIGRGTATEDEKVAVEATMELLGLTPDADKPVESLSLGRGRIVELARALQLRPSLLLLDEPSSGLDRKETFALVEVLHHVREERGTAILLVEHDLEMVLRAVTRLYVLDFGTLLASGAPSAVMADPRVREAYLGSMADTLAPLGGDG
jgi:branched-chain amino acid transport system ATP-binding protein